MTTTPTSAMRQHVRLDLREERSGLRHYLAGEPVHCGTGLWLVMADGSALRGRYEWTCRREDKPLFYVELGPVTPPPKDDPDRGPSSPVAEMTLPKDAAFYVACEHGTAWHERCRDCRRG